MWNESKNGGPGIDPSLSGKSAPGVGRAPAAGSEGNPAVRRPAIACGLARGALASALLWPGGVLAHCDPANGHFECPTPEPPTPADPVPGPHDRLLVNATSKQVAPGSVKGVKVKAEVVNQRYSNDAQQKYLLVNATVRLPAPGIANRQQAHDVRLTLRYFHYGETQPYAECLLEPRKVAARKAIYSLGMKSNAAHTLLRWGHCDDPRVPGFDATFPISVTGDTARLEGPDGAALAEFSPPVVVDVPSPAKSKKRPRPAAAKLLEGGPGKIKTGRNKK